MASLVLAWKDLRLRLRDRSFLVFGILVPLGLTVVLANLVPGSTDSFSTTIVMVDETGSGVVSELQTALAPQDILIVEAPDRSAAVAAIESDEANAGIVIPDGFFAPSSEDRSIEVLGNPTAQISTLIADALAQSVAAETEATMLAVAASGAINPLPVIDRVRSQPPPVVVEEVPVGDRQLDFRSYMSVGVAIFFLYFTVQFGILSILEEQRDGTMARLLAAPIRPAALLVGKSLASVVTGLVAMGVLVVATTILMGADWGNPLGLVVLVLAGIFSAMGIGALLGTLAKTAEQASNFASIVAVVLGLLGGSFFPVAQASGALAALSKLSPHAWLLQGFGDNTAPGHLGSVLAAAGVVVLTGLIPGAIAVARRDRMGVTT